MADINIEIKNLPQIHKAFREAPKIMNKEMRVALAKSAFLIERRSKLKTPVDTGYLRSSHLTSFVGTGLYQKAEIMPRANYAIYVHEGTRYMKGRPFLRRASEESLEDIQDFFTQAVDNALTKVGRMT